MVLGNGRVRGAIIATTAAAALGTGMLVFAAQSSADTTKPAAGAVPVKAMLTPWPQVGEPVEFSVTGQAGGTALVEWSEAVAPAGVTFTSYGVWFYEVRPPAEPTGLPTSSPTPTLGPPLPDAAQSLPATARSTRFIGLKFDVEYRVVVAAMGPQGQTPQRPASLYVPNLGLTTSPAAVAYGSAVTLGGVTPRSGETVTLERRAAGTSAWTRVGALRSGTDKRWSVATKPAGITAYRVTYAGSKNFWPATATRTVTVRYLVSVKASTAKPKAGQAVTISGAVRPIKAGVRVSLQRKSGTSWITIAGGTVKADGSYAIGKAFAKGTWPLRVVASGGTSLTYGTSGQVTVVAK